MCTAIRRGSLFGRTLDLEYSYSEAVSVTPRIYGAMEHFAIIGMATVAQGYPLYYDGMNEKGLCMAALNFPRSAAYPDFEADKENIATYELIPFVLGGCKSVREARESLAQVHIYDGAFSPEFPPSPLHWMIADERESIVLEVTSEGTHIYDNEENVLTNEPPFPVMLEHAKSFSALTAEEPQEARESRGEGALGLPGDWSSRSRFVRAAFALSHTQPFDDVAAFFRAIGTVEVPRGCVRLHDGGLVFSRYTCCMDMKNGVYYYKTYDDSRITAVDMRSEKLDGNGLASYPIKKTSL